jgi:poly-gamma-glutamate synthesis protein (capsule biosynthesis protein)
LWIEPDVSPFLNQLIEQVARTQNLRVVSDRTQAALAVTLARDKDPLLLTEHVYAVADRFATLRTGVKRSDLQQVWQGKPVDGLDTLIVAADTASELTAVLGAPGATVKSVPAEALVDTLWRTPRALALLPFDRLTPEVLALSLDGENILDSHVDVTRYPLVARVYVQGKGKRAVAFYNTLRDRVPATNRDPGRMTSLVMTGVTAMARYTADTIDRHRDPAYPARVVAPILAQADITHVSNEIPFVENCPPNLSHDSITLCSKPEYIATFQLLGVDIVGLTGNHAGDFGFDNYVKTLELYERSGMKYYAGGRNLAEARKPLVVEHNGNRIAFLGANSFGPQAYWATPDRPGTNGYDAARMRADIATARQQADVVLVEFQADEVYDYKPDAENVQIFRRTLKDGADVVTGVQNHQPAAVEFSDDGTREILYGLGNFSFDQMFNDDVRSGLVPRHLIYEGRLLQTELLTTMLEDYAQPRWATPAERERILRSVFGASGFKLP